jgi:hypothetical protein
MMSRKLDVCKPLECGGGGGGAAELAVAGAEAGAHTRSEVPLNLSSSVHRVTQLNS